MTKIYAQGNYIVIEANNERKTFQKKGVGFEIVNDDGLYSLNDKGLPMGDFNYSEVKKEDGSDYATALEFETFLFENTGNFNSGADVSPNVIGSLKITDTAPTTQGLYILSDVGTYTNLGGLVTTTGKLNYAYFDGTTWSNVEVAIPSTKLPLYSAIKSANISAGTQFIYDEGDNEILRTTATLLTTDNPLSVIDVKTKYVGSVWANKNITTFTNTGKYYLSTNGVLATSAAYNATPLYRVKEGMKFKNPFMGSGDVSQAVFLKSDKSFLSAVIGQAEITAPAEAFFVGFTRAASSTETVKVQSDFWAAQLLNPAGVVAENDTNLLNGGEAFKGFNMLSNEINISSRFPTGSKNGNAFYTLETAITKLTAEQVKVGLKITFRTSSINSETYQLVGVSGSPYYLNPANYVRLYKNKDIEDLTNDINLTKLYGSRYTLETAVPLVTSEFGKLGLRITFRTVSGSANTVETWQLIGNVAGSYPTFYNNPDNYVRVPIRNEIISWINEINISTLFPKYGTVGDSRYTLSGAIAKIPTELVKVGLKVTFRTDIGTTTETWVLVKSTLGGYSSYHLNPDNYERVPERFEFDKLKNDYNSNTNNRLANMLFESRNTWNTKNPTNQIESLTIMTNNPTTGNYRIPCSIITNAGTILAASELRPIDSPGDYGDFSIELYRKTAGGTVTNTIPLPFNYAGLGRFMEPSFVIDRTGAHGTAGRIYLFAGSFKKRDVWDTNSTAESDYIYITSDDDGVTWSTHTSVKSKWDLANYNLAIPAPNNGIQLADGSLVIPSFSNRGSMILVKEVGQDWYFSKEAFGSNGSGRIDECTVVERENDIVLIGRNNKNYADYPYRGEWVFKYDKPSNGWISEESTFSVNRSNQLSICKAVIAGRTLYLKTFTDSNTTDRCNLTLWASVDLKTWIRIYRIYAPGGNGYSSINYYNNRLIVSHETSKDILFQELTPLLGLITDSITTNLESNVSVQDRMQMIINMVKDL